EVDPDGNPIMIPEKDVNGDDVYDENGNVKMVPMLKAVDYADIDKNTTGSANNAISSARTANTSNSEYEARTAAQTAWDELEKAEEGFLDAGKAVYEATEKVNQAEKDLAAAEAAKKAAQEKYNQLKAELKNGQTNATAANEQLKAAERNMNALDQAAQKKYEDYIGGKENLDMLINIDKCNQDLEDYIAKNIDKNEDGSLVFKSENGRKGYENDSKFWANARKLSLALLEYSIKNGKIQAYNTEDNDNLVKFEDGYTLVVGDNFKVTLTTYSVPENPTAADVEYDDNGQNPHIKLKEEKTDYEFDIKTGKWKDGKAVKDEEKVKVADGMIKGDGTDAPNRVVVTFRDSEGNEIGSLPQFYFNYKVNPDGTVYYYQRTFTKDTETVEGEDRAFQMNLEKADYYLNGDASNPDNDITKYGAQEMIVTKDENTKLAPIIGDSYAAFPGEALRTEVYEKLERDENGETKKIYEYSYRTYNGQDSVMEREYEYILSNNGAVMSKYLRTTVYYKVKEYKKIVTNDEAYVGYSGYTNETGITWEPDSVKQGDYQPDAQTRAQQKGQLTLENGQFANNFDYVAALKLKHVSDRYNTAAADVKTASAATQKLKDDIDELTVRYNGIKAKEGGNQEENRDPDNELYKELQRLDNEISKLRQNLNAAKYELAVKTKEFENLEKKVWEARDACAGIDLSRFNGSGNGDDTVVPSDTTPDTGDITVTDEIPVISYIPSTDASSGVAGVRTGRIASRSGVAGVRVEAGDAIEGKSANKTVVAAKTGDKKTVDLDDSGKKDTKKVVKLENNAVPLADKPFEEGMNMNLLWLLLAAVALLAGAIVNENHRRKVAANEEAKRYNK
ncbi:MAG: hypothetical protein J5570_06705, partial [Lachnospiraceae bacterium]|nr:hypothetical protein [Lachnospiraceae bacterium]